MELLDCGHPESEHGPSTRGYGVDGEGKKYCYACCRQQDLEAVERGEKVFGYLSRDENGRRVISNWPGSPLLRVCSATRLRNRWTMNGYTADDLYHIRALDSHGREWYGRGMGEGMYARMRPTKETLRMIAERND